MIATAEELAVSHECGATTNAGTPCPRWAVRGHRHCFVHDPAFAERLKAAQRRGGLNRRERPPRPAPTRDPNAPPPRKIEQPHGGALYTGGVRGNRGGSGRPSNRMRRELLKIIDRHGVPFLAAVLDGVVPIRYRYICEHCGREPSENSRHPSGWDAEQYPTIAERLTAVRLAARSTIPSVRGISDDEVRERLVRTLEVVLEQKGEKAYRRLLPKLRRIWRDALPADEPQPEKSGEKTGGCW